MIGIIGGTGFYNVELFGQGEKVTIETEYGSVEMLKGKYMDTDVLFLPRHGFEHNRLAYQVNHKANLVAFKSMGVSKVIATVAAGGINSNYKSGDLVLVDQFISMHTYHTTYGKHSLDMTYPYCSELRDLFIDSAKELGYDMYPTGTYFSFDGPRYETAAEIKMYKQLGADLVGMTNAPEATLARELGICYSVVAMITNMAAGLSSDEPDLKAHGNVVKKNTDKIQKLLCLVATKIPEESSCRCEEWYNRAITARS